MIRLFCGRPRNGKSLHATQEIYWYLIHGKNVICNYEIDTSVLPDRLRRKGKLGHFIYVPDSQWTDTSVIHAPVQSMSYSYLGGLYGFAQNFHRFDGDRMIEGQTLLVFDECHNLWNPRTWNRKDRLLWADFFRQHGHYGYDVLLITQDDTAIDKQIRGVIEMKYEHRNVKNYKAFGWILALLCGGNLFVCIQSLYGLRSANAARVRSWFFRGKKKYYRMYNTTHHFGNSNPGFASSPTAETTDAPA